MSTILRIVTVCQILTIFCQGVAVAQPAKASKLPLLIVDGMNNNG